MARGYTRINWKGVEGQESYIGKTQIPLIIIIYYHYHCHYHHYYYYL